MSEFLSIGALSKAVGVPTDTLRTWERRYGFPEPTRLPSGHRRYPRTAVSRLALIKRAMASGLRASSAVPLTEDELAQLLGEVHEPLDIDAGEGVAKLLELARDEDADGLRRSLEQLWAEAGAMGFVVDVVGPFLVAVGTHWATGGLSVGAEHLASETLRDFLFSRLRGLKPLEPRGRVVCASLPGERHTLGLHMAATVVALESYEVAFYGADLPVSEIVAASRHPTTALLTSVSAAYDPKRCAEHLRTLRARLPAEVPIFAGGAGAAVVEGVELVLDFRALRRRLAELV